MILSAQRRRLYLGTAKQQSTIRRWIIVNLKTGIVAKSMAMAMI